MPLFFKKRDLVSKEQMDDPNCDKEKLFNTYEQFSVINALISRWHYIYKKRIAAKCNDKAKTYSLLDIGFGGGDLVLKIAEWAKKDGINLDITAIESDDRAFEYVKGLQVPPNIRYLHCSSSDLVEKNAGFDFIISNHLLHHLTESELLHLLDEAKQLSTGIVLFNDIERSSIGYASFNLFSRLIFRNSFITQDGLTSIKRSYTAGELKSMVPAEWKVEQIMPYRLLLHYTHG